MATFLPPVEKPKGLMPKLGYSYSRRQFGKIFSPMSVFCARIPSAFTRFYMKIGSLDKKLELREELALLITCSTSTTSR